MSSAAKNIIQNTSAASNQQNAARFGGYSISLLNLIVAIRRAAENPESAARRRKHYQEIVI